MGGVGREGCAPRDWPGELSILGGARWAGLARGARRGGGLGGEGGGRRRGNKNNRPRAAILGRLRTPRGEWVAMREPQGSGGSSSSSAPRAAPSCRPPSAGSRGRPQGAPGLGLFFSFSFSRSSARPEPRCWTGRVGLRRAATAAARELRGTRPGAGRGRGQG